MVLFFYFEIYLLIYLETYSRNHTIHMIQIATTSKGLRFLLDLPNQKLAPSKLDAEVKKKYRFVTIMVLANLMNEDFFQCKKKVQFGLISRA